MSSWTSIDPQLMQEIAGADRAPLKIPTQAVTAGGKSRWSEMVTVVSTEYEEKINDQGENRGTIRLKLRVSETAPSCPENAGKILSGTKTINYTQLVSRQNDGQYQMSTISIRQLTSLLIAAGVVKDRSEIKSFGDFFAAGSQGASRLAGATVIAQIEHGTNRQGEPQQEAVRFAPYTMGG